MAVHSPAFSDRYPFSLVRISPCRDLLSELCNKRATVLYLSGSPDRAGEGFWRGSRYYNKGTQRAQQDGQKRVGDREAPGHLFEWRAHTDIEDGENGLAEGRDVVVDQGSVLILRLRSEQRDEREVTVRTSASEHCAE